MYWSARLRRALGFERKAELPDHFSGPDSAQKLRLVLSRNPSVSNDQAIVEALIEYGDIVFFRQGEYLITQGGYDSDVYFLLSGEVDIVFKVQVGSKRVAPNQVGEMAAMEPGKPRSATVIARTDEVAALKVPGAAFSNILASRPDFRERLDFELRSRQRERIDVNDIVRRNLSRGWFFTAIGVGLVVSLAAWVGTMTLVWTEVARLSVSSGLGVAFFFLTILYNPAYFWRRCFMIVVIAMVGKLAFDKFLTVDAQQGLGSLAIKVGSCSPGAGMDVGVYLVFAAVLAICAVMDSRAT